VATLSASMSASATDRLRLRVLVGSPLGDLAELPARVQRGVTLARALGAPLLPAVDAAAEAQDDDARARRAVDVSTAQARTVAGGLALAPLVLAPAIGRLAGVDTLGFYVSSTGRGVLTVGLVLLLAGGLSARLLIARASRPAPDGELEEVAELVALALSAGAGTTAALRAVAEAVPSQSVRLRRMALDLDLGIERDARAGEPDALVRIRDVITTASALGAPAAPTLRRLARDLRAGELARVMAASERLPAQLTVPTTLLLLPATLLLVGAPLVVSGLSGVLA
jgi:Flp pilus assembly protein TadB